MRARARATDEGEGEGDGASVERERVAHPLERVLPAGEHGDEAEETRALLLGRDQLRDSLPAKLRQVLCDPAKHLSDRHVHDCRRLVPLIAPAEEQPVAHELEREAEDQ